MKNTAYLIAFYIMFGGMFSGFNRVSAAEIRPPIFLSEIAILPESPEHPRWVEIVNKGSAPMDISGWVLSDRHDRTIAIPRQTSPLPPDGFALVILDSAHVDAVTSQKNAVVITCSDAHDPQMLAGTTNECALYANADLTPETMLDYLCWGIRPDTRTGNHTNAVKAGLWRRAAGVYVGVRPAPGDGKPLLPGGSLARMRYVKNWRAVHDWAIREPNQTTPGGKNEWLPPLPHVHGQETRISYEKGAGTSFAWRGRRPPPDARTRIQIAWDQGFQDIVADVVTNSPYSHKPALLPGAYYWRVRYELDAEETAWSRVARIAITEPPGGLKVRP